MCGCEIRALLGGNLCFNDPHSDPGTVLLVHNASVTLGSQRGERQIPLHDFFWMSTKPLWSRTSSYLMCKFLLCPAE